MIVTSSLKVNLFASSYIGFFPVSQSYVFVESLKKTQQTSSQDAPLSCDPTCHDSRCSRLAPTTTNAWLKIHFTVDFWETPNYKFSI